MCVIFITEKEKVIYIPISVKAIFIITSVNVTLIIYISYFDNGLLIVIF